MNVGIREMFSRRRTRAPTSARRALVAALVVLGALPLAGGAQSAADSEDKTSNERRTRTVESNGAAPSPSYPATDGVLERFAAAQAALAGERFAGSSWQQDGTVLFGVVDADAVPAEVRNHPNFKVAIRRFSSKRLDQVMETVAGRLNPLLAPGRVPGTPGQWPWEAQVETIDNVVSVLVDRAHESKRAIIEGALAAELKEGSVRLSYGSVASNTLGCASRENCSFPFRGGTRTNGQTGCTLGFVMKDWAGVRFQTTAGHCPGAHPAPYWHSHNVYTTGHDHWTSQANNVDLKIIRQQNQAQNAPANFIFRDGNTTAQVFYKNTNPSETHTFRACYSGATSNREVCGTISSTNGSYNGVGGHGIIATNQACRGDSGAPVFHPADNKAYGLFRGLTDPGPAATCISDPSGANLIRVYFTWVSVFEAASGHSVLLTPTTETLGPGQRMHAFDRLQSTDGRFELKMQNDGNLVVYQGTTPLWSSNTWGNPGAFLSLQNDGNLVIYRGNGTPIWSRGCCVGGTRLVMQNDSNLVMYQPAGGVSWARTWG